MNDVKIFTLVLVSSGCNKNYDIFDSNTKINVPNKPLTFTHCNYFSLIKKIEA